MGSKPVNNMFVFNDIGKEVLEHIYQGYNSTIFAYGQTGAGKSYSIEGYEEPGLLQMCLEDIFSRKEKIESEANGMAISVKVTYL
jgi:kinesin family protein 1